MKIKVIEESENLLVLELCKIDNSLVNAIRRICIAEVSTYAVDTVDFIKNTGILNNEYVAHRLGLCVLKVEGELKSSKISLDFVCEKEKEYVLISDFTFPENIKPVFPNTKISVLTKGQELTLEANIKEGSGLEHSKWSPVCPAFFRPVNNNYHLTIESTGSLTPREIFNKAIEKLDTKLETLTF